MRSKLRSSSLFEKHTRKYHEFFAVYDLIVSAPGGAILAGAQANNYVGIALQQTIPLRNYVGIKPSAQPGINIVSHGTYDIFLEEFCDDAESVASFKRLIDYFHVIKEDLYEGSEGLEIGILQEIPRRHGLNTPGVFSLCIACLESLLKGQNSLTNTNSTLIRNIEERAIKIHEAWLSRKTYGFGALASSLGSDWPIIFQPSKTGSLYRKISSLSNNKIGSVPYDITIIGTTDRSSIDFFSTSAS